MNLFDIQMKCGDVEPVHVTQDWLRSLPERPFGERTPSRRLPDPDDLPSCDEALRDERVASSRA
jgi:hypothetical protein